MSHETNGKFKLLHKPTKTKMQVLSLVFVWIAIWNVVYQYLHGAGLLHFEIGNLHLGVENWAFFAAVTLFFMQEELSYKDRFWQWVPTVPTCCGRLCFPSWSADRPADSGFVHLQRKLPLHRA